MKRYKLGEKLIYKFDGRIVEFRGYSKHDLDGAYVYPLSGYGNEIYVSVSRDLTKGENQ